MPIFAALAAISAVAGVASTVSGLSAQAASKSDIKRQNKAASLANDEVELLNDELVAETKNQNTLLRTDVQEKNAIISDTNEKLTASNANLLSLNTQANEAIVGSNAERAEQVSLTNDLASVTAARSRKTAVREAMLLRGRTINLAANSGAGIDSSGVKGGLGSLQSQLADTLGFSNQQSSVANEIFQSSQREQDLVNKAQQLQFDSSVESLKALEVQRKAEKDLQLQQNASNLRISKSNNKINLIRNEADRIKESAQLDPKEFLSVRENTLKNLTKEIVAATNKGETAFSNDGAVLTQLPGGGVKKTFANGTEVKRRANGVVVTISPDGTKTVSKPDGTQTVTKVDISRIQKTIAKVAPIVADKNGVQEPGGGGGF